MGTVSSTSGPTSNNVKIGATGHWNISSFSHIHPQGTDKDLESKKKEFYFPQPFQPTNLPET